MLQLRKTGVVDRLRGWARDIKRDVLALYLAARDPRVPWYAKVVALAVAAYALSPIDLIPDFIPAIGYLDDLIIVPLGILLAVWLIPPAILAEHRAAAAAMHDRPVNRTAAMLIIAVWIGLALITLAALLHSWAPRAPAQPINPENPQMKRSIAALSLLAATVIASTTLVFAQAPDAGNAPGGTLQAGLEVATFAGGCFWCTESDFDKVAGVKETISGFMGGQTEHPTYEQVSMGGTGHAESVQLKYDPKVVSYQQLLDYYWRHVDLLDGDGQFCDRGNQYRPVIFAHTPEQKKLALDSKAALEASKRFNQPIAVEIVDAGTFTPAEDYHQNYHETHPLQYRYYRYACGRDARLETLWGAEAESATH